MFLAGLPYPMGSGEPSLPVDPYGENVILKIGFDGEDGANTFTDESTSAHALTAFGNAQIDTSDTAFGVGGSGLFDGSGDYITANDSDDFHMTGDFTLELWVRFDASGDHHIFGQWTYGYAESAFRLAIESGVLKFVMAYNAGTPTASGAFTPTVGEWYYLCVEQSGNTTRIYKGQAGGATSLVGSYTYTSYTGLSDTNGTLQIGGVYPFGYLTGAIDDVRFTKGVARYGAAGYTVPDAFPREVVFDGSPVIASESGFYGVGDTLTVTDADYSGGISSARQWKANGVAISGATGESYTLTGSELGATITVTQTVTVVGGQTASETSSGVGPVVNPTYQTDTRIAGTDTRIAGADTRVIETRIA